MTSIAPNEEEDDEEEVGGAPARASFSAPSDLLNDVPPNDQVREVDGVFLSSLKLYAVFPIHGSQTLGFG